MNEQLDKELCKIKSGKVSSTGASVPRSFGCSTLPASEDTLAHEPAMQRLPYEDFDMALALTVSCCKRPQIYP